MDNKEMKTYTQFITERANDQELTPQQLKQVEKFADELARKFKIDVEFTKHFIERVNDERNKTPITAEELKAFFQRAFKKFGGKMRMLGDKAEATLKQISTDLNVPFIMKRDARGEWDMVNKTIMRKKNFKTDNFGGKDLQFEEEDLDEMRLKLRGGTVVGDEMPHEPIPHHVDMWYDRYQRLWTIQLMDKEGNQIGDSDYEHHKNDAKVAKKRMEKEHKLK